MQLYNYLYEHTMFTNKQDSALLGKEKSLRSKRRSRERVALIKSLIYARWKSRAWGVVVKSSWKFQLIHRIEWRRTPHKYFSFNRFPLFFFKSKQSKPLQHTLNNTSMKCVTNLNNQSEMIIFESLLITVDLSLFQLVNCKVGILTHYQGLWHSQTMLMFDRLMLNDKWYNFNFISEEETTSV